MPSTCSQANLLLQDGAGVGSFCDVLGCTATQEDPDTGGLQQITGWEFAGKGIYEGLDENGEPNFVDQYGLFPIWTDVDPGSDYLAQGPAANNGYMVVNGNYVFPTKIDKYNPMEQGKDNYRDLNTFCSTHVTVDQTTGQVQSHVDLVNPEPLPTGPVSPVVWPILHVVYDGFPDLVYRATGMYLVPPGRSQCQ
ncbi:MAG TPA: hypothetical protein VK722_16385 [Candidatus Aquilonibacter sp.]|jgi:hypothetical protein|nr:hypothetical protein [Candidatus Aquilonibacter sp.]